MAQASPRCPKMAPQVSQEAPRTLQDGPRWPRSLHRRINAFCWFAFSLPMAFRGLKIAPRRPMRAPRGAQESPRTAPNISCSSLDSAADVTSQS
eukprot:4396270-Pyramimonas_sp.AAC.1